MPHVARLTWQAADPAGLASSLAKRLGVTPVAERERHAFALASAVLEVVPWLPEHPGDRPRQAGRLVLEPVWEAAERGLVRPAASDALALVAIAWGTVELDRAEADLAAWLEPPRSMGDVGAGADLDDPLLGAVVRVRLAPALPGGCLALAEPTTEGRLAASLARDAEGPCGLYLAPATGLAGWTSDARARGVMVSRASAGPLGRSALVLGGPVSGPHVVVVDAPATISA